MSGFARRHWAVAAALVGVLAATWWYERSTGYQVEKDAKVLVKAEEAGDGATLYNFSYNHEKVALGLTPAKLSAVYQRLVLPRFAGFHPRGPIQSMVNRDASQAQAWEEMVDNKGHKFDLVAVPWATPQGSKTMAMARLMTAWIVEYRLMKGKSMDSLGCVQARLEGLSHDRRILEEIGIPGMVSDNPGSPMQNWDQYKAWWEGMGHKLEHATNQRN